MAHICSAQIYFAVHKFIFQCTNISSQCTNISSQCTNKYFSVHKYISQCTNTFSSAQMYFSVHKYISQCMNKISVHKYICSAPIYLQCTNIFPSAQIHFPVHKYITQCTNTVLRGESGNQCCHDRGLVTLVSRLWSCPSVIAAIFGRPETQLEGKTLQQPAGSMLVLETFSQMTLQLKPSIHPCIGNP